MQKKTIFLTRRYILFIISVFINAYGIAFITKALLGTSPITSVNYVLSMFTPLTMGQWTIIVNLLFVATEPLMMSRSQLRADLRMYLIQIPRYALFRHVYRHIHVVAVVASARGLSHAAAQHARRMRHSGVRHNARG